MKIEDIKCIAEQSSDLKAYCDNCKSEGYLTDSDGHMAYILNGHKKNIYAR